MYNVYSNNKGLNDKNKIVFSTKSANNNYCLLIFMRWIIIDNQLILVDNLRQNQALCFITGISNIFSTT